MKTSKDKKMPKTSQTEKLDPKKMKDESTSTKTMENNKSNSNKDKKGCC